MSNVHDMGTALDKPRTAFVGSQASEHELSEYIRYEIGEENMLLTDDGLYLWSGRIWCRLTEDHWRYMVQGKLKQIPGLRFTARKVSAVANLARTDSFAPDFKWPTDAGDAVACINGVVRFDGSQWNLEPHRREDYRTSTIPVEWQPDADCPRFQQFLSEVFDGDPDASDKPTALLEMIGYTLMQHTRHERFIILVGKGANGKSKLLEVIVALCGEDNVAAVSPNRLDQVFQRAALSGKLANIVTELKRGQQIEDGALKSIVSGEPCTVERKFSHPFTMYPYATQWYGTNHLPGTRDFSYALFRRALMVPFNRRFAGKDDDRELIDKLKCELPGILRLALEAYGEALRRGSFTKPESCEATKDKWRLEADQVARWAERSLQRAPGGFVLLKDAYQNYREWAEGAGIRNKVSKEEFQDGLDRLEYQHKRRNVGIAYEDLKLVP